MRFAFMDDAARISAVDLLFALEKFFGAGLFTLRGGVGALPAALDARLRDVRLGARVVWVEEAGGEVEVTCADGATLEADACAITLSAPLVAGIYPQLAPELAAAAARIRYVSHWPS